MKSSQRSTTLDHLVDRVRLLLDGDPRITEKTMFGGLTFLLNGHILVACKKNGTALLSVGKENNAAALARPGATQMVHGGRVMQGFVWVDADSLEDDDGLEGWVRFALDAVGKMPPAAPKPAKKPKTPAMR